MFYDKLRDEIIESQRTQHDLMKWKLFLIAAIGAAGLGAFPGMMAVTARTPTDAALKPDTTPLLALIPLVCLYVDTLCFHNVLRVMAIARYCRSLTAKNPPVIGTDNLSRNEAAAIATYENYCKNNRRNFALEGFALVTTSVILSGLVIGFGLWPQFRARLGFASLKDSVLLLVVGISGLLFSLLFFTLFKGKVYWLDHSEPKTKMSNRGMKRLFFKAGLLLFLNLLGIVEFSEKRLEALVPRGPEPASDDEPQPLAPPPQTSASGTEQPPTAVYEGSEGPKLRTLKPQPGSASGAGDFVVKGENDSGVIAEELKVQHDDSS